MAGVLQRLYFVDTGLLFDAMALVGITEATLYWSAGNACFCSTSPHPAGMKGNADGNDLIYNNSAAASLVFQEHNSKVSKPKSHAKPLIGPLVPRQAPDNV